MLNPTDEIIYYDLTAASTTAAAGSAEEVYDYISLRSDVTRPPRVSILVAGDAGCGKTALIRTFIDKYFPTDISIDSHPYFSFIHRRTYNAEICVDQRRFELDITDTLRSDRVIVGPEDIDVVLLCYSVDTIESFSGGVLYWHDAVRCASAIARRQIPVLLIGLKVDTRIMCMSECSCRCSHVRTVSLKEGYEMAHALQACGFYEASAYHCKGVKEVFENAVRATAMGRRKSDSVNARVSQSHLQRLTCIAQPLAERGDDLSFSGVDKPKLQHPIVTACPQPLAVSIPPSLVMEDRRLLLESGVLADVVFMVDEGNEQVAERFAHSVILSAASPVFSTLFTRLAHVIASQNSSGHLHRCIHSDELGTSSVIESVQVSLCRNDYMHRIRLNYPVTVVALDLTLRFIYTGGADLFLQGLVLDDVIYIARLFSIAPLSDCCHDVQVASAELGGYVNMGVSREMVCAVSKHLRRQFYGKWHLSDVKFDIGSHSIPAHRALLVCRSDVMRAMLTGPFSEEQRRCVQLRGTSEEALMTFLEFVYTGEVHTLSERNTMEVLALADQFCLPRLLSLCESYVSVRLLSWGEDLRDSDMVKAMLSIPDYNRESVFDIQRQTHADLSAETVSDNVCSVEAEEGLLVRSSSYRQALNIDDSSVFPSPSTDLSRLLSILETARMANAKQLVEICRYVLATNYDHFSQSPAFRRILEEDRSYVEVHRWPPQWAEETMQVYREQLVASQGMCEDMGPRDLQRRSIRHCCVM